MLYRNLYIYNTYILYTNFFKVFFRLVSFIVRHDRPDTKGKFSRDLPICQLINRLLELFMNLCALCYCDVK